MVYLSLTVSRYFLPISLYHSISQFLTSYLPIYLSSYHFYISLTSSWCIIYQFLSLTASTYLSLSISSYLQHFYIYFYLSLGISITICPFLSAYLTLSHYQSSSQSQSASICQFLVIFNHTVSINF